MPGLQWKCSPSQVEPGLRMLPGCQDCGEERRGELRSLSPPAGLLELPVVSWFSSWQPLSLLTMWTLWRTTPQHHNTNNNNTTTRTSSLLINTTEVNHHCWTSLGHLTTQTPGWLTRQVEFLVTKPWWQPGPVLALPGSQSDIVVERLSPIKSDRGSRLLYFITKILWDFHDFVGASEEHLLSCLCLVISTWTSVSARIRTGWLWYKMVCIIQWECYVMTKWHE